MYFSKSYLKNADLLWSTEKFNFYNIKELLEKKQQQHTNSKITTVCSLSREQEQAVLFLNEGSQDKMILTSGLIENLKNPVTPY